MCICAYFLQGASFCAIAGCLLFLSHIHIDCICSLSEWVKHRKAWRRIWRDWRRTSTWWSRSWRTRRRRCRRRSWSGWSRCREGRGRDHMNFDNLEIMKHFKMPNWAGPSGSWRSRSTSTGCRSRRRMPATPRWSSCRRATSSCELPPRSCEETALASSCFEKGREHADKNGGVKEGCPMSDFNLKPFYKSYWEFVSGNVFDLSKHFCLRLFNKEQTILIVTTTPIHIETLVFKNQCIQSKVIDVLSDPCWHPFKPSQMVTYEKPQKSPSDPPNSANNDVKGDRRTWLWMIRYGPINIIDVLL